MFDMSQKHKHPSSPTSEKPTPNVHVCTFASHQDLSLQDWDWKTHRTCLQIGDWRQALFSTSRSNLPPVFVGFGDQSEPVSNTERQNAITSGCKLEYRLKLLSCRHGYSVGESLWGIKSTQWRSHVPQHSTDLNTRALNASYTQNFHESKIPPDILGLPSIATPDSSNSRYGVSRGTVRLASSLQLNTCTYLAAILHPLELKFHLLSKINLRAARVLLNCWFA